MIDKTIVQFSSGAIIIIAGYTPISVAHTAVTAVALYAGPTGKNSRDRCVKVDYTERKNFKKAAPGLSYYTVTVKTSNEAFRRVLYNRLDV